MRPVRQIVSENFCYDITNYAADADRMAVRVLAPISTLPPATVEELKKNEPNNQVLLHSTAKLAYDNAKECADNAKFVFEIDGTPCYIALEIIFDKNNSLVANSWTTMSNFGFVVREGKGEVIDTAKDSYISRFRTGKQVKYRQQFMLAQIFCRDKTDRLIDCAKSFTTKPNGRIITKLPLPDETTPAHVVTEIAGTSRYLNVLPIMEAPATCKPNELVEIKVQFYQGGTNNKVNGINYDGLIIEAVDGYCPHKRVKIRDGKGSFKVRALDLEEGEEMRIKLNTAFFTSKAECIIKVTSKP